MGRNRVARLMREMGLYSRKQRRKKRWKNEQKQTPAAENLLARDFSPTEMNQSWCTDIKYIPTTTGWGYLAPVMDLFSRKVVGWRFEQEQDAHLVVKALEDAWESRRKPKGVLVHSDQGSQFSSNLYRDSLKRKELTCSMSRKGNCWDNAVIESFFSTLEAELLETLPVLSFEETHKELFEYIEGFYNRERMHSTLDSLSPQEYEERVFT